nr:MAG TPA: hypothetical protein [Caudoviricetes sp.]
MRSFGNRNLKGSKKKNSNNRILHFSVQIEDIEFFNCGVLL